MKKFFLTAAIVAFALSSCTREKIVDKDPIAVKFANGVITRASGTEWAMGDKVGIYMLATATTTPYEDNANVEYVNSVAGEEATFTVTDPLSTIYYPTDSTTKVDFLSYYPYSSSKVGAEDYIYEVDVNSQTDKPAIDLLISNNLINKTVSNEALEFNFYHALAQMNIEVKAGVDVPSLEGLEITVKGLINSAEYDITSDAIDFGANVATDLEVFDQNAIIIPQSAEISFVVKTDENPVGFETTPATVNFEQAKSTKITLTLNKTAVSLEGDATINDWVESGNDESFDAEQK